MSKSPRIILATFQTGVNILGLPTFTTHTLRTSEKSGHIKGPGKKIIEAFTHQ